MPFPQYRAYVFDLDGVLYRGAEVVPFAADAMARLRAVAPAPPVVAFLTNNSTQTRDDYAAKLGKMGIECRPEEVVTSASVTANFLAGQNNAGKKRALVVGGAGLQMELSAVGIEVTDAHDVSDGFANGALAFDGDIGRYDYVVAGLDRRFTYGALVAAQQAILGGAKFIASNRDGQYPVEGGNVIPGAGAVVAAIAAAANAEPLVMGKPEPHGLQSLLAANGLWPDELLFVGDRLDTDVLCGNRVGVATALVLTGVTNRAEADAAHGELRPGVVWEDLRELV